MRLISSNTTLLYRLFLPMFVTATLIAFCCAFWTDEDGGFLSNYLPANVGNIILTSSVFIWILFAYKKLWNLRRVSIDDQNLYISDYWNTTKYSIEDIESISEHKTLWLSMAVLRLRGKGRFGRDIKFIKGREAKAYLEGRQIV
jgi:hypothetical protein